MENGMVIKKYEVDYSFIIRNYLSPKMWEKVWTLFLYKNFRFTLQISRIEVDHGINIVFKLKLYAPDFDNYEFVTHNIDNSNITILKKQISGQIKTLINSYEKFLIRKTDVYNELKEQEGEEEDRLRDLANDYLDDNNITLQDVREAYIDKFVSDNLKGSVYTSNYMDAMEYKLATDLWLIWAKSTNDETLEDVIKDSLSDDYYQYTIEEINNYIDMMKNPDSYEYINYFDEAQSNMKDI